MSDLVTSTHPHRQYRSPRRQFRHGRRAAVVRALTGARLYTNDVVSTLEMAAEACGSNAAYVAAGIVLLKADNAGLVHRVLAGEVSILTAAREARRLVDLVTAYRLATDPDRVAFARACGVERIFDTLVQAAE